MIAFEEVQEAVEALARDWVDTREDGGTAVAMCLLDQLPGTTMAEFEAYAEAYSLWYRVAIDRESPDTYLSESERAVMRRWEWWDFAIERLARTKQDALDVLMRRHPILVAVAS